MTVLEQLTDNMRAELEAEILKIYGTTDPPIPKGYKVTAFRNIAIGDTILCVGSPKSINKIVCDFQLKGISRIILEPPPPPPPSYLFTPVLDKDGKQECRRALAGEWVSVFSDGSKIHEFTNFDTWEYYIWTRKEVPTDPA
jgi:hypothetical protein